MKKMKRRNFLKIILTFLMLSSLFSCKKKFPDGKPVANKPEVPVSGKPFDKNDAINDKLLQLLFISRENVSSKQELEEKINEGLSIFSPNAVLSYKNFVYNDEPFSENPRGTEKNVEIDNISWDVDDDIRVLSFTERLRIKGEIVKTRDIDLIFQIEKGINGNFTVKNFIYQSDENQEES
jgi:lipoprotein